jgi:predicted CXXCH cytochrome family protein
MFRESAKYVGGAFVALALSSLAVGVVQQNTQKTSNQGKSSQQKRQENPSTNSQTTVEEPENPDSSHYAGTEMCKSCHEEQGRSFERSAHASINPEKFPAWHGCESCHGPGKEHAESGDPDKIVRFAGLSREDSSHRCSRCHKSTDERANFSHSKHLKKLGCLDCHSEHSAKEESQLLKKPAPQLCSGCHSEVKRDLPGPSSKAWRRASEGDVGDSY